MALVTEAAEAHWNNLQVRSCVWPAATARASWNTHYFWGADKPFLQWPRHARRPLLRS